MYIIHIMYTSGHSGSTKERVRVLQNRKEKVKVVGVPLILHAMRAPSCAILYYVGPSS